MNLKEVKELIELMGEKGLAELEIERQGFRLRISRFPEKAGSTGDGAGSAVASHLSTPPELHVLSGAAEQRNEAAAKPGSETSSVPVPGKPSAGLHVIKSPIVGTFYRASSPTSEPFVRVGDTIEPDTVVCIIEAMKLMNEIHAEIAGVVTEIYPPNAQAVEYGEPLFGITTRS